MRVCMLAYTFYHYDNRVKRYAEALAKRGDHVDVIALRENDHPWSENCEGVKVYQVQGRSRVERSKVAYLLKSCVFFCVSSVLLIVKNIKEPYDLIHVHTMPDFEVFAAWLPKLMGAKIILDMHDLVPDLYISKFRARQKSVITKILLYLERSAASFADHVIISNHIWEKKLIERSVKSNKCSVMLNYPDPSIFYKRIKRKHDPTFIMMYPGTLNWHQGLDIAVKGFSLVASKFPGIEFHIYGEGSEKKGLSKLILQLNLKTKVLIKHPLPLSDIADKMANADLGVVPKRNDSFGNEAFSTKTLEFMSLGVPLIVADTKVDKYYFDESVVKFFKSCDIEDFARCLELLISDRRLRNELIATSSEFVKKFSWSVNSKKYFNLVDDLVSKGINKYPLLRNFYYNVRPFFPRWLLTKFKKKRMTKLTARYKEVWPIQITASEKPPLWKGWPQGKRFALVLTHDVESAASEKKCYELAELEKQLGFRSSFNLVPREFSHCDSLRDYLVGEGFEIGVHGLFHDGKLYKSRAIFLKRAGHINMYLKRWNSVGFRSPSMHHNLNWMHDLEIEYDASTFDTDPFEPQPDEVDSIYPLWIQKSCEQAGYIELPYTLPQDSTLFIFMEHNNIDVWKKKLDWIAENGGMALVNTHPDYMHFGNDRANTYEYPVEFYTTFLKYIMSKYNGSYWHILPREMARFWKSKQTTAYSKVKYR